METVDVALKKKYVQQWNDNMSVVGKPKITSCSTKPFTRITFLPDYARFGMHGMTDDLYAVLEKRVYDLAATTPPDVAVSWNGVAIKLKNFEKYTEMFLEGNARVYEKVNDRWEVAVGIAPDGRFNQVSFVNGICTVKGGKHVDAIVSQVCRRIVEHIASKRKKTVKQSHIKDNIWVFVNCVIENASYESQSKVRQYLMIPEVVRCSLRWLIKFKVPNAGDVDDSRVEIRQQVRPQRQVRGEACQERRDRQGSGNAGRAGGQAAHKGGWQEAGLSAWHPEAGRRGACGHQGQLAMLPHLDRGVRRPD